MKLYILGDFENPKDVLPIIIKLVIPIVGFEKNNAPGELTEEEKKSEVETAMYQQHIKLHVGREVQ